MSSTKPLKIWYHGPSPNPWKVVIVLEEFKLPYELCDVDYPDMKKEPFISLNPNGRVPALEDPNTGVTTFESASCVQYLVDTYDKEGKLSYSSSPEKYEQISWAYFQMSGQGPYFGQKAWFAGRHPEKIPSAIERYDKEIQRVLGVLDAHLTKTGNPYLIGDKVTYADLLWVPWNGIMARLVSQEFVDEWEEKYPKCHAWHQRLLKREAVKKALGLQMEEVKKYHPPGK